MTIYSEVLQDKSLRPRSRIPVLLLIVIVYGSAASHVIMQDLASPLAITLLMTHMLPASADVFVREEIVTDPIPGFFNVCHGNGCAELSEVSLSPAQWQEVRAVFMPPTANAAEERKRIARAVGLLERMTGVMIGTMDDQPGTFAGLGSPGQMDCIDEWTRGWRPEKRASRARSGRPLFFPFIGE